MTRTAYVSGHCAFDQPGPDGTHPNCRHTIANGDGSILTCGCGCHQGHSTCRVCGRWEVPVGEPGTPAHGVCLDVEDCLGYRASRHERNPIHQMLEGIRRDLGIDRPEPKPGGGARKAPHIPRAATGGRACRCGCGETTGGGHYRPGHDSRHLSAVVTVIQSGGDRDLHLGNLASDALRAKAIKRLGKGDSK